MKRLRELRHERRWSLSHLAKEIGLNKNTLGQYERGERQPDIETIKKLCAFFKVSADYLLEIDNNL